METFLHTTFIGLLLFAICNIFVALAFLAVPYTIWHFAKQVNVAFSRVLKSFAWTFGPFLTLAAISRLLMVFHDIISPIPKFRIVVDFITATVAAYTVGKLTYNVYFKK